MVEGEELWRRYFSLIRDLPQQRYALIEFVKGNEPEQLLDDARTLRRWLAEIL